MSTSISRVLQHPVFKAVLKFFRTKQRKPTPWIDAVGEGVVSALAGIALVALSAVPFLASL